MTLSLLLVLRASAANINLATTIATVPTDNGSAPAGTVVTIQAITANPSASITFANVKQQLVISNISAALFSQLTFTAPTGTSISHSGTTVTIGFPMANLPPAPNRVEEVSFTVPSLAASVTINAAASSTETDPDNNDNVAGNSDGTNANANNAITLLVAPPTIASFTPNSGAVGTSVVITGTNFSSATSVSFGGTSTTAFTINSPTQITLNVPTGASSGVVSVVTPGGTATGATFGIGAPVLQSFAPVRNALMAPLASDVSVTFNQSVTNASASGIRVFSSQVGGLRMATAAVNNNTASVNPNLFNFKAGEVVSVTVPGTVQNSAGNNISNPQVYQFTTATQGGTGVFNSFPDLITGTNPSNQVLADVDGDGRLDVAVVNYGNGTGNTVSVSRYTGGSGAPSLAPRVDFALGAGVSGSYNIAAGDFDGDGKIDLVTANYTTNNVSILQNTAAASGVVNASSFAAAITMAVGTGPSGIAVADMDGDGKQDIVASNLGSNNVTLLRNTSSGATISFAPVQTFATGTGTAPYGVIMGDLDGDGKLDIITANSGTANVSVLRNTTAGTTFSFAAVRTFGVGNSPYTVAVGDLNSDGLLDVVTANNGSSNVSVLRNTTTGTTVSFSATVNFAVGTQPVGLALGDVNSDGKLDVLTADYNSTGTTGTGTTVSLLLNTTASSTIALAARTTVGVGTGPNSVNLGDLDGDGDLDFVTANQGGDNNTATIRINNTSAAPLPLPVALTRFTAEPTGRRVTVRWTTAMELNSAYFDVERSFNGYAFAAVGRVASGGNSSEAKHYHWLDSPTGGKVVYYRLRQVDKDGTATFSQVRTVALLETAGDIALVPNPAPASVMVDLTQALAVEYTIQVRDLAGRLLYAQQAMGGQLVAVAAGQDLKRGVYLVTITGQDLRVTKRLIKE